MFFYVSIFTFRKCRPKVTKSSLLLNVSYIKTTTRKKSFEEKKEKKDNPAITDR